MPVGRIVSGLLTGFGLDFLAGKLTGPNIDRATLQLVGLLFASILLPGLAGEVVAQRQKQEKSPGVTTSNTEGRNA
eukprot:3971321-Amphidinium_carterae.2